MTQTLKVKCDPCEMKPEVIWMADGEIPYCLQCDKPAEIVED